MATIVQKYGPIYGEVVNGTVQGRPNGSVYVPISNTIAMSLKPTATHIKYDSGYSGRYVMCTSAGVGVSGGLEAVAQSQDLASKIAISLYSDAALTTQVGTTTYEPAGIFNVARFTVVIQNGADQLVPGNTYYILGELINNGVAVATSTVLEVTAL